MLLNDHSKIKASHCMPELFYISDKQKTIKYFDFDDRLIKTFQIECDFKIPLFAGIGSI
jgi:hypothetical protein